jgi:aspartate aminotransferase
VTFPRPRAAFYAFFAVDGVTDSYTFALDLLNKTGVGLAPGAAFGPEGEGYLRLCHAAETDLLQRAFDKMRPMLK